MTEPTQPWDAQPSGLPPMPVPPPRKAGRDPDVRPTQVLLGMLLGAGICAVAATVSGLIGWAAETFVGDFPALTMSLLVVAWLAPVTALVWAIWRAAHTGRKGLAIGMALFAGLAVLLAVACAGLVFALR